MKRLKLKYLVVASVSLFLLTGCATVSNGSYVSIPAPQAGLVLPIHRSPGVWAECILFEGSFREEDLIIPHSSKPGKLMFSMKPLKHFTINPPMSRPYRNGVVSTIITVPLLLSPYPTDYTLLVFHKNMRGWVVEIECRRFQTSGYAFDEYYISAGRKIWADEIVRLRRVKPYQNRRFRFHRIYYPGHALKDALGW